MPGQTSFYCAIFKKLQATGRALNVHVKPDSDPNGNYGGFSLESPENLNGIFGGLGANAPEAGRQPGDKRWRTAPIRTMSRSTGFSSRR